MALRHVLVPACLLSGLVLAAPRANAEEVQITDSCRTHFGAGVNFLTDPDGARYEDAYREFKVAYSECPSWKILGNFGLAAMKLERDGEAIDAYTKYLEGGKDQIDPAERTQYSRDLNTLKAAVAWVTLKVDQPGATLVDVRTPVRGEPVYNRYSFEDQELKIGIRPGHHKITVSVAGYQDAVWEFDAPSSANLDHSFEMKKPEVAGPTGPTGPGPTGPSGPTGPTGPDQVQTERPVPVTVYITGGLAIAGFVGFGVLGALASGKKSDYDKANDGTDPTGAKDLKDSGEQLNLFADVALGVGVVAGVLTAVFYLTRPEKPVATMDTGVSFSPAVGPGFAGAALGKRF